jgi:toxin ParE1/3/4
MTGFRLSPRAVRDLEEIDAYIAEFDPRAAERAIDRLLAVARTIGATPGLGVARDDIAPGLRLFPAGANLLLYRSSVEGIEIVRIVHAARRREDLA